MTYGIVVALIYAVWHIVSFALAQKAKKDEQEAARTAAARRSQAQAGAPPTRGAVSQASARQPQAPVMGATPQPSTGLADKRRQQLEQLRQRRAQRTGGAAPTRTAQPARPVTPPRQRQAPTAIGIGREGLQESVDKAQQARDQDRLRRQQLASAASRQAQVDEARKSMEQQETTRAADLAARQADLALANRQRVELSGSSRHQLGQLLSNRRTLRELIVLKEVLDKPVSMRGMI